MNFRDYHRTSEAAEFLGLSPGTIRNGVRQGNLKTRLLPQNGYRLFPRGDLEAVLRSVHAPKQPSVSRPEPRTDAPPFQQPHSSSAGDRHDRFAVDAE